jgi:hypothetical protein
MCKIFYTSLLLGVYILAFVFSDLFPFMDFKGRFLCSKNGGCQSWLVFLCDVKLRTPFVKIFVVLK